MQMAVTSLLVVRFQLNLYILNTKTKMCVHIAFLSQTSASNQVKDCLLIHIPTNNVNFLLGKDELSHGVVIISSLLTHMTHLC